MPRRQHPQPLQVPHAGATVQFHQADQARRRALQRGRARSTNHAAEAALARVRMYEAYEAKLKAAEEACARKDEMLARQRREAAEHWEILIVFEILNF